MRHPILNAARGKGGQRPTSPSAAVLSFPHPARAHANVQIGLRLVPSVLFAIPILSSLPRLEGVSLSPESSDGSPASNRPRPTNPLLDPPVRAIGCAIWCLSDLWHCPYSSRSPLLSFPTYARGVFTCRQQPCYDPLGPRRLRSTEERTSRLLDRYGGVYGGPYLLGTW